MMRPQARHYDEHEHQMPWDFVNVMWDESLRTGESFRSGARPRRTGRASPRRRCMHVIEMLSWGDAGIYLCGPGAGLGGAAIEATGTPEQKKRFLDRYREGKPKWASMAMTEPHCGSDTAAIRTTAVRDGDHWVLNGEKIFVTSGHKSLVDSEGFMVVWATVDPTAGRAGMKPFVVEAGTPGVRVTKLEQQDGHPRQRHRVGGAGGLPHPARQPAGQRRGRRPAPRASRARWRPSTPRAPRWRPARSASRARRSSW